MWPNLERALQWIDTYGDSDGDGFVEYSRQSKDGLVQHGWKDSNDSVFHANGKLAENPIALCEVQGYVYAAKRGAAHLALVLGDQGRSSALESQAAILRKQFDEAYWCDEISTYALTLDGDKRRCIVRTSNPGHCLYTGIASADRAYCVAHSLLELWIRDLRVGDACVDLFLERRNNLVRLQILDKCGEVEIITT